MDNFDLKMTSGEQIARMRHEDAHAPFTENGFVYFDESGEGDYRCVSCGSYPDSIHSPSCKYLAALTLNQEESMNNATIVAESNEQEIPQQGETDLPPANTSEDIEDDEDFVDDEYEYDEDYDFEEDEE